MQPRLPELTTVEIAAIGITLGLGNLVYGAFAATAIGAVFCIVLGEGVNALRARPWPKLMRVMLLASGFFLPLALWMAFVTTRTGRFYSHEVAYYRQFVWIIDSASRGASVLVTDLFRNLAEYAKTLATVAWLPVILLAVLGRTANGNDRETRRAVTWYLFANVPFYALMGFYRTRLTWTIVPPLLLLLAERIGRLEQSVSENRRRALRAGAAALALAYAAYWFVKVGPYS
jgi:hypothetical protein